MTVWRRTLGCCEGAAMGMFLRIGYRQIFAIRDQVVCALGCIMADRSLSEWIYKEEPALAPYLGDHDTAPAMGGAGGASPMTLRINTLILTLELEKERDPNFRAYLRNAFIATSQSDHQAEDDFGSERASFWDAKRSDHQAEDDSDSERFRFWEPKRFVLRSGMVFTLGAQDDFEVSIVRVLLNNKDSIRSQEQRVFRPTLEDFRKETSEWKKRERDTHTCKDRRNILEEYGLKKPDERKYDWAKRLNSAWKDRNAIVHGKRAVNVSLTRFLEIHYDVFSAMNYWARECEAKHIEL